MHIRPIIVDSLYSNSPVGKIIDSYEEMSISIKDSCDGSGLNTSENSKDSHPLGLRVFWSDIVQLS